MNVELDDTSAKTTAVIALIFDYCTRILQVEGFVVLPKQIFGKEAILHWGKCQEKRIDRGLKSTIISLQKSRS